ncbi:MAG TPA: pyrroloquinoline quinone biosynthesis peptide chaperone PqqD [Polyangiaceae bacterium]
MSKLRLAKKARLRWDEREKKHMLVYPERGLFLNETAAEIVKALDGTKTLEEIRDQFAPRGDSAATDVVELVEQLRARGLLEDV